jgi:hypothetical protein
MRKFQLLPTKEITPLLGFVFLIGFASIAPAAIVSNIGATKHNLSAAIDGTGNVPFRGVKAASETQICVFCHTPHNSNQSISAPLWNRNLSASTYTTYTSNSMDATATEPTGDSRLCLSCHDGTLAVGTVGVLNGKSATITMTGVAVNGTMPNGAGANTGFTRNIGINLRNDHPISFTYDAALGGTTGTDGELRSPPYILSSATIVGNNTVGANSKPIFPLQNDQLQCTTCHDPHLADTISTNAPLKFLRGNRVQLMPPIGGVFALDNDIMCLACHDKSGVAGESWANSAHANEFAADETYTNAAADELEFSRGTAVWQASCSSCHDTHSVEGSTRLLREGTNAIDSPKSGGTSSIEQTCYQCHSISNILEPASPLNKAPDIKSDFSLTFRMPVNEQPESHNIGGKFDDSATGGPHCNIAGDQCGKDFVESQALLGKVSAGGNLSYRHAECTDCHNPHRATKNRLFNTNSTTPDSAGTHKHNIIAGDVTPHNNLASGSLRGTFGVEPTYMSSEFGSNPSGFNVKRGDIGVGASDLVTSTYVTREYQVCLKCHSNYSFDSAQPPPLSLVNLTGGTPEGTNGVKYYSDVAMEFQAPTLHQGEPLPGTNDSGAESTLYGSNNHRSWHPVMEKTGRTSTGPAPARPSANTNLWRAPWNGSDTDGGFAIIADTIGTQTMQCGDCHGSTTLQTEGVVPFGGEDGAAWGPHGSNENFILKGSWYTDAPNTHTTGSNNLCFRCHEESQYADASASPSNILQSGFSGSNSLGSPAIPNLHQRHAYLTTQGGSVDAPSWPASANDTYRCTMCHTGTAHGWKNKAFLTNLNDLGSEILAIGGETPPSGLIGVSGVIAASGVLAAGDSVPKGTSVKVSVSSGGYSNGPYYRGSLLSIETTGFKAPGTWVKTDCGTSGCHLP